MSQQPNSAALTAIVLAGQRASGDPVALHTGAACKALVEIDEQPLLLRVLAALQQATQIGAVKIAGPEAQQRDSNAQLADLCTTEIEWHSPQATPSTSAYQIMQALAPTQAALLTSADHPYLSPELADEFCQRSLASKADVTVGLAPYDLVGQRFPTMQKTVMRFSDAGYCGCNLFGFMTVEGRRAADFWRQVEDARKSPLKVISLLGWWPLIRYKLGCLSLEAAMRLLSKRLGLRVEAIILPYGEAAVDVDSVDDYEIVQRDFQQRRHSS